MRTSRSIVATLAAAAVLAVSVAPAAYAGNDVPGPEVAAIRGATAELLFADDAELAAAGYASKLPDGDGVTYCIDAAAGGMGVHYVNGAALTTPGFDLAKPEVLVYEPETNGRMHLVAVEFVTFAADVPAGEHPAFVGQDLEYEPGPLVDGANRYGLPAFYALHEWAWKHNPSGMFEDYNPRVQCPGGVSSPIR